MQATTPPFLGVTARVNFAPWVTRASVPKVKKSGEGVPSYSNRGLKLVAPCHAKNGLKAVQIKYGVSPTRAAFRIFLVV